MYVLLKLFILSNSYRSYNPVSQAIQRHNWQQLVFYNYVLLQRFLESLAPFDGVKENEVSNYLYNKSLEVEPRNCKQAPRFVRDLSFPTHL